MKQEKLQSFGELPFINYRKSRTDSPESLMQTPVKKQQPDEFLEVKLIKRVSNSAQGKHKPPMTNESVTRFLP